MNRSYLKETQDLAATSESKPIITGESLMVDKIQEKEVALTNEELALQPIPDNIRKFLDAIPDTDLFKVEEMRKKYMKSFDMTEEQYNRIAEEILEEGFVLT